MRKFLSMLLILVMIAMTGTALAEVMETVIMVERICQGWGIGIGGFNSQTKLPCHFQCVHYKRIKYEYYEITKVEICSPEDYGIDPKSFGEFVKDKK